MRHVLDIRGGLGNETWWVILPEGVKRLVQVPDTMRKAVVFLYGSVKGEVRPAGTAFLCGYPVDGFPQNPLGILLTADHVIRDIRSKSDDGKVLIRFNTRAGGADWASVAADCWVQQRDSHVDCAFLPWRPDPERSPEYTAWNLGGGVATSAVIREEGIGIGDEIFMVGLFRNHLGHDRNEPIIRVGNIAAIPADPVKTRDYGNMRAILIEARSIGGLSGSPVFVHMGFARWRDEKVMRAGTPMPFFFLGLLHGRWEAREAEAEQLLADVPGEKINTGISAVVPAEQIMDFIRPLTEEVAKVRKEQLVEENQPTPGTALGENDEFENFEALARKLVNVPKKELDEKRKERGE